LAIRRAIDPSREGAPMILYYAPTACSIAPHIALEEIGVPFEARRIDLAKGEQLAPEFRAVNPQGRVPALVIDGQTVTELPALLTYVANLRPEVGLIPEAGTLAFARCFEWLGFLSSSVHVGYAQFRRPGRFIDEGSPCLDELSDKGRQITIGFYREVERRLGKGWAVSGAYSIADINLFPFYTWAWRLDFDMKSECPKWTELFERVKERPAVQRALEREGLNL
jgi:glutathione S-transferase